MWLEKTAEDARNSYIPVMRPLTARLLEKTVFESKPERIIEIGTSIGTSGIRMLWHSERARLVTVDIDIDKIEAAKKNFKKAGVFDRSEFIVCDCTEYLLVSEGICDFAVIDGPKGRYRELTELLLEKMPNGGTIFADDIGFHGKALVPGREGHKHRTIVNNMKDYTDFITQHPRLEAELFDIEDGVAVIKVRKENG